MAVTFSVDELRYEPKARQEGQQRAQALDDGHLIKVINYQQQEARDATMAIREDWKESWRYYQSEIDWSDKETWQSQIWVPMPWAAIEQATAIIQRSLLDSPEFFGIEGFDERDRKLADLLWRPALKRALTTTEFIPKFTDAAKISLALGTSGYFKFRYPRTMVPTLIGVQPDPMTGQMSPQYETKARGFLELDVIPPAHIFRDPRTKARQQFGGTYLIHEDEIDRPSLYQGAASKAYRNLETLPESSFSSYMSSHDGASPEAQARRKGMIARSHELRHPHLAREWWGDLLDENGDVVMPDALMMAIADTMVYGPIPNPLWAVDVQTGRRKWPFIAFAPISHPYRFDGLGILKAVTPLASLFSNLFNLFADGLNWDVNQEAELDLSVIAEMDDFERYPGKLWIKNSSGQAIQAAKTQKQDAGTILATLQFVDQLFQNNSFVTNYVTGLPGNRQRVTKGEVQIKTQQSMGMFDGIARNMEGGARAAVELAYDYLHQYLGSWSDPSLADIVGPMGAQLIESLPLELRMKELKGAFNYSVTGISSALQKADQLGRLMQAAQIAGSAPYLGYTNPSQVMGSIIDTLGLRDRIEVTESPMVPLAQAQQMVAEAAMMGGGGGAPPGPGGPRRPAGRPSRAGQPRPMEQPRVSELAPLPRQERVTAE